MTACSAATVPSVVPITDATLLADRLSSALAAADESVFADGFSDSLVGQAQASRWFTLLRAADAELRAEGPDRLQVVTTLPGDRRPATEQLSLHWAADGTGGFSVAAESGTPLWALEPATLTTTDTATVLSADADLVASWTRMAATAVAAVRASEVVTDGWSGRLVLELPRTAADFALLTGSTAATSSAVTSCRTGTPRIVLNPSLSQYPAHVQLATLTHEAVHAATDSACQHGLAWAVEGLAESVAAEADPATAKANRALVISYLAEHPVPSALPQNPSTPTDYALVQLAADQVRKRRGGRAPEFFDRATRGEVSAGEIAQATAWYQTALRALVR